MKKRIKYPYGESNFGFLIKEGYVYVDKTFYIEELEYSTENHVVFLRPRRFGKSLFVSILEHYYGKQHEKDFDTLFGKLYIGKNPTPKKNSFWILKFNFSGIDTTTREATKAGFLANVKDGLKVFIHQYLNWTKERTQLVLKEKQANLMLQSFLTEIQIQKHHPIYLLIDEYDHFTNELTAFDFMSFQDSVSRNGYVRKFYEIAKTGVDNAIIQKIFMTGVSPITVDGLTSGFNITKKFGMRFVYNEMMGFTEKEVIGLLEGVSDKKNIPKILDDLRQWYDGYLFNREATTKLYNADMVLYFLTEYQKRKRYPDVMLDTNIASDYSKLRNLFALKTPVKNYEILNEIVEGIPQTAQIVAEFSFEKTFNENDFLSLLYYLGFLSFDTSRSRIVDLKIPNYVIKKLYFDFFIARLTQLQEIPTRLKQLQYSMREMAYEGNPILFFQEIEHVLRHLSRKDYQNFEEKHVKTIIMSLAIQVDAFFVKSERGYQGGYTDILFLAQPSLGINFQYVLELKYMKKENEKTLSKVQEKAKKQLSDYVTNDAELKAIKNLQAWTVVVVKDEVHSQRIQ